MHITKQPLAAGRLAGLTLLLFAAVTATFAAPAAAATGPIYSPHTLPILPYRGMYYEPGHGGTGLTVDIDKKGFVFATFYTYTPQGQPYWYVMQGTYQGNSEQERVLSGVLGSVEATPYIAENGECIGPGCSYRAPTYVSSGFHARIQWTAPRVATLTIGSQVWHLRGGQYTISEADMLLGQWFFNGVHSFGEDPVAAFGSLVLAKTGKGVTAADFSGFPHVSPDAVVYDLTWRRIPLYSFLADGETFFAVYSPESGRMDIFQGHYNASSGQLDRASIVPFGPMFLDGPGLMRGRHEMSITDKHSSDLSSYSVVTDITLTRSPYVSTFLSQNHEPETQR